MGLRIRFFGDSLKGMGGGEEDCFGGYGFINSPAEEVKRRSE